LIDTEIKDKNVDADFENEVDDDDEISNNTDEDPENQ
jgi:hypothetical protein